jgi:hypothetical protein
MYNAFIKSRLAQVWKSRNIATFIILSLFTLSYLGQNMILFTQSNSISSPITPQESLILNDTPVNKIYNSLNNSLGEINITQVYDLEKPNFAANVNDETVSFTLSTANLTYSYTDEGVLDVQTISPASLDRSVVEGGKHNSNITFRLNQTVTWRYNSSVKSREVGFQSKIQPARLNRIFITLNESTTPYTIANMSDYRTSESGIFYFNFTKLYEQNPNGTIFLKYEYDIEIPITDWQVTALAPSNLEGYIYLNQTNLITQKFHLNFSFGKSDGPKIDGLFKITVPDPDSVFGLSYDYYNEIAPNITFNRHSTLGNIITTRAELMNSTKIPIGISFSATYNVSFLDLINGNNLWFKDRLVEGFKTRERSYKLSVLAGPAHLALSYLRFNETFIHYSDTSGRSFTSQNGRSIAIENMNKSTYTKLKPDEPYTYVGYRADGISVIGSSFYIYKGEVDVVVVKYTTQKDLQVKILDNINNPLEGYRANFYFADQKYGSFISSNVVVPYPTIISESTGLITVKNVPRGNYTVEIFDAQGRFVKNVSASTEIILNELQTDVTHFPTVILVYTGVFGVILLLGIYIYRKNSV